MTRTSSSFAELADTTLECRTWTHPFRHVVTYSEKRGRSPVLTFFLKCPNCKAERWDTHRISDGERIGRRYIHPDGYLIKGVEDWGGRKVFNQNVRKELVNRHVAKAVPRVGKEDRVQRRRKKVSSARRKGT